MAKPSIDEIIPISFPPLSDDPDWSSALYSNPPSHDFCVWLVIAELMRREHGASPPLKVRFLLEDGQLGKYDVGCWSVYCGRRAELGLPKSYSDQMMTNVLRPAIDMIGAINEPDLHAPVHPSRVRHYCEYGYFIFSLVDAARAGYKIPHWTVPEWAMKEVAATLKGEKPVVITLRESTLQPERNSQLIEWFRFAETIHKKHPVIFLRDTAEAYTPLGTCRTFPRASTDAYIRAALYAQAHCNMMVGNGPMAWCLFSDAPYLFFKQLVPALVPGGWEQGSPEGWQRLQHMYVGQSWPWADSRRQRLTWQDDTFELISREFETFERESGST